MNEVVKFNICVFGDSISYGWFDFKKRGWVPRLREILEPKGDYRIFNLSIPGETTTNLLRRFKNEAVARGPNMIIFAIGMNDSQYYTSQKELRTPPQQFKNNIHFSIEEAKSITNNVFFIGLTPVDESLADPLPRDVKRSLKNKYIQEYNTIIKEECSKEGVIFVDIFSKWVNIDYKKFLSDGIHPNEEGHEDIFKFVFSVLKQSLKL